MVVEIHFLGRERWHGIEDWVKFWLKETPFCCFIWGSNFKEGFRKALTLELGGCYCNDVVGIFKSLAEKSAKMIGRLSAQVSTRKFYLAGAQLALQVSPIIICLF